LGAIQWKIYKDDSSVTPDEYAEYLLQTSLTSEGLRGLDQADSAIAYSVTTSVAGLLKNRAKRIFFTTDKMLTLGRLCLKEEAAGKLRVFAIVDFWTQTLLQPLHAFVFQVLK
jgi:hypothetical protein